MTNPVRPCHGCGQTDDHPRHHHVERTPFGDVDRILHLDCCASLGCPGCKAQIEGAEGLRGDELRQHIQGLGHEFHAALQARLNAPRGV